MPREETLSYPLLARHVDIHRWLKGEGEAYYGPNPYEEICINIVAILDLTEQEAITMIGILVGLASRYRELKLQLVVLQQLQAGHFFHWARFLYRGMMS